MHKNKTIKAMSGKIIFSQQINIIFNSLALNSFAYFFVLASKL